MGRVYKDGGLYRIAVGGELRKRYPKRTTRFRVPYRTLLTGVSLDLVVLADLPLQGRNAQPFEVVVNLYSTDTRALGELVLLDWQIALDSAWLAKRQVYQPLGVWIYERGAVVVACLKETPRRLLKDWLNRAKGQDDSQLIQRLSSRVRPPDVKQASRLGSLQKGGYSIVTLSPAKAIYPFRDAPTERVVSERVGDAVAAKQRYKERLPPALRTACEAMDFGDLRRFIDDCLAGRKVDSEVDCPRSEEEFLGLLEMLREKIDMPGLPDVLPNPGALPPVPRPFLPSERLLELRAEQRRLGAELQAAQTDPDATKRSVRERLRKLELWAAEVRALETREREEQANHRDAQLRSYRKAKGAYELSLRRRNEAMTRHKETRSRRLKIVERVERDIKRAFEFGTDSPTGRLPWRLLPPGELSIDRLRRHYLSLQRQNPHIRYDPKRIERAYSLGPQQCYVGTDEFDGYVVFTFARTNRVLLECPVYGNAIYVLGPDWKRLSRMSKQELLSGRSGGVTKIVHKGDWFGRAKLALGIR